MEIGIIILLLAIAAEVTYLVVQTQKKTHGKKGKLIFVDTSVLIDGRIVPVAKSGFITDTLAIPRSVVGELQFLADHADSEKRGRARYGLDVITELQAIPNVQVEIFQDGSKAAEGVDERLLKLAKEYDGVVCTIDFNLNKVAQVENIPVLNVNDLAMSLRMAYLPGEKIMLELTQKGQDGHQAIGHLQDGTMVVVEHASQYIGKTVQIEFIRGLQTAAGKMMFAKCIEPKAETKPQPASRKAVDKTKSLGRAPSTKKTQEKQPVATPNVPAAYHSDPHDRRLAKRVSKAGRPAEKATANRGDAAPKRQQQHTQKSTSRRPKTSAQREDSLINLVNSQE